MFSEIVGVVRKTFNTGRTKNVEWRRSQLTALLKMINEKRSEFLEVLKKDLNKNDVEATIMEIDFVYGEIVMALNNLVSWTSTKKAKTDLVTFFDSAYTKPEPYGVILIIGAWNYPIQLVLSPLISALAAGNCAIIKPSEMAHNTAILLEKIIPQYLDNDCVKVVNGGVPETTSLLKEVFDYIFYTGNNLVAKIILKAAAENLTPCTLELGGKSPVFVDDTTDVRIAARRLVWGKFSNAGQTCIAPDYALCTPNIKAKLIDAVKETMVEFYGEDPEKSDSYGRIISAKQFNRLLSIINSDQPRIVYGGVSKEEILYIQPTLMDGVHESDTVMSEEIFGPIFPFLTVADVNEAIAFINKRDKPLALYIFSNNKKVQEQIIEQTSSGGVCINDCLMHMNLLTLPFGGVGKSGMGCAHSKHGFDTFSHIKSCLVRGQNLEKINDLRYPPYTEKQKNLIAWVQRSTPKQDRYWPLRWLPF